MAYQRLTVNTSMVAVPAQKLVAGKKLPFDIYIKDIHGYKLLSINGAVFNSAVKATIEEKKLSEVYVSGNDQELLDYYMLQQPKQEPEKKESAVINPFQFAEYSNNKSKYFHIEKNLLVAGTTINFSIFVVNMMVITTLIEAEEYAPGRIEQATLEASGDLLVKNEDIPLYQAYVNSILPADKTKPFAKATAVKENMKVAIKGLFEDPKSGEKILESHQMVSKMVDCVLTNSSISKDLLNLMSFDYYTYTHSVNVAVMAIGLGAEMNMDRSDIEDLGVGALLHDIGKSAVPVYILNKQGKLNYNEYILMQSHVVEGKTLLKANPSISENSIDAISQHHEKMSGKGYPFQLSGSKISAFGKITAIADCFDALTTQKPYRSAYAPFHALSLITKETGDFDQEYLTAFIKMLARK